MDLKILHISDLHLKKESTSESSYREMLKEEISRNRRISDADCLIVSGDLFNRGCLDIDLLDECKDFFCGLPGCKITIVVPGNHDADRTASRTEAYNMHLLRRNIVLEKGNFAFNKGEFTLTDNEKEILYTKSFDAFMSFSKAMGFKSFVTPIACDEVSEYPYEVQVYDHKVDGVIVRFVLLNTALIAGQSIRGDDYQEKKKQLEEEHREALQKGDSISAAKKRLEIAELVNQFEKDGETIIDEQLEEEVKHNNNTAEMLRYGRLSLSKDGTSALIRIAKETRKDGIPITIFVGHHGYQYLSYEMQKVLKQAMEACGSGVYLCGHAHEAGIYSYKIGNNSKPEKVQQIQAGVMYGNGTGQVQYGFNFIHFKTDDDKRNIVQGTGESHFLISKASGEPGWAKEEFNLGFFDLKIRGADYFPDTVSLKNESVTILQDRYTPPIDIDGFFEQKK